MFETQPHSPVKRAREESDLESDSDEMDFQQADNVTATQAIGDDETHIGHGILELPPPLSAEYAALRADFETITMAAMEQLYSRITADIVKSAADTTMAFQKTTDQLRNQITSLGTRVTQLQQQILTYERPVQPSATKSAAAPVKKILKTTLTKRTTDNNTARTTTTTDNAAPVVSHPGSSGMTRTGTVYRQEVYAARSYVTSERQIRARTIRVGQLRP